METIQFSFYFLSKKLSTELAIEVLYQQQLLLEIVMERKRRE